MENIHFFLDSSQNISYDSLERNDRKQLATQISSFYIPYRDFLNLPLDLTFGVEIEYENLDRSIVDDYINKKLDCWLSKTDGSLVNGGEINSPILYDEKKYWLELKKICSFLKEHNANTCQNAGGHVHIGAQILGEECATWRKFIKIYTIYENILFRFAYGEKLGPRKKMYVHANPIAETLISKMWRFNRSKSIIELGQEYPSETKRIALNLNHVLFENMQEMENNTIEFRFPNATVEASIWQNNINTFAKMILAAKSNNIDEEYLDKLLKEEDYMLLSLNSKKELLAKYNGICFNQAIQFADLIFDNNLDKTLFLRQYVKSFEKSNECIRSRAFKSN